MSPSQFKAEMERAIKVCHDRAMLAAVGEGLINRALGYNAFSYLDTIDRFCRRLRELQPVKEYGPPTVESIGEAKDVGEPL